MSFTEDEISEFKVEAAELLDQAEKSLLALDQGADFHQEYDAVFRAFHSIKGAAGMMEMLSLQSHMHQLENLLVDQKSKTDLAKHLIDHFLLGVDGCRKLLDGEEIEFSHHVDAPASQAAASAAPLSEPSTESTQQDQKPASQSATTPARSKKRIFAEGEPRPKIMVIDDESSIISLMTDILEPRGFEVAGFDHPEVAIKQLNTFQPDAVLTDIMMPVMTGLDVLREIRKTHADLPVIFVSAHADKKVLMEAIEMGVYAVLEKPFHMSDVLEVARNAIERHRLMNMLNHSINLLMYQFSDLDDFLVAQGKTDIRNVIDREIKNLLNQKRRLKKIA